MKYPSKCCLMETVSTNISKYLRKLDLSFPCVTPLFHFSPTSLALPLSQSLPHFCYHSILYGTDTARNITQTSEKFRTVITQTAWLAPSKLLANPLEAKLPEKCLRPRRLVKVPLLPAESRSLIAIVLALLPSAKFVSTKKAQNF